MFGVKTYKSLLGVLLGYSVIALGAALLKVEALKQVANVFALMLFVAIVYAVVSARKRLKFDEAVLLVVPALALSIGMIINGPGDLVDTFKILSIFVFFCFGSVASDTFFRAWPSKIVRYTFLVFPLCVALAIHMHGRTTGGGGFGASLELGMFANRNNAVLFAIVTSWIFLLEKRSVLFVVVYCVAVAIVFNTVGAIVALAASMFFCFAKLRNLRWLIVGVPVLLVAGIVLWYFGVFLRAEENLAGLVSVFQAMDGVLDLGDMTYGEISNQAGTSDISSLFRLKHWINIVDLYESGGYGQMIFGYGVGAAALNTDLELLPHNDYLRFMYELGLFPLAGFIYIGGKILRGVGRSAFGIPAYFYFIYAFSENIVNNYCVSVFFFSLCGVLSSVRGRLVCNSKGVSERCQ